MTVLAQIPMLRSDGAEVSVAERIGRTLALLESFRMLRTSSLLHAGKRVQVYVTSSLAGEGSPPVASTWRCSGSRGERVIWSIATCGVRSLHLLWGLSMKIGFSSISRATATLEDALQESGCQSGILTSGPRRGDQFTLLHSPAARLWSNTCAPLCDSWCWIAARAHLCRRQICVSMSAWRIARRLSMTPVSRRFLAPPVLTQTGSNLIGMLLNRLEREPRLSGPLLRQLRQW
jgi:hypothetical protein